MQRTSKRLSVFAIVACVVAVLAFGGTAAFAAGTWWNPPEEGNTLTVGITNDDTLKEDILKANVVVDLYKVAAAEADETSETFNYTMTDEFAPTENDSAEVREALTIKSDPTNDDWDAMAEAAVGKINGLTPAKTTSMGENDQATVLGIEDGLFLVVAHGDGQDALHAASPNYGYTFKPILVAIPGKAAQDGVIRTDDSYGDWLPNVSIMLKPSQEPLYGSLRINKTVEGFYGEESTFVFHIVSTDGTYENYAAVMYPDPGYTIVKHIKAGTTVTVEEVYEGARQKAVGAVTSEEVTIKSDSAVESGDETIATVAFTNEQGVHIGGHGIENNFTLEKTGDGNDPSKWDWSGWIATPEYAVTDEPTQKAE